MIRTIPVLDYQAETCGRREAGLGIRQGAEVPGKMAGRPPCREDAGMREFRDVAREYLGDEVLRWGGHLEALARRLAENHIGYWEYLAYVLAQYPDVARYQSTYRSERVFTGYADYRVMQARKAELNAYLDAETLETHVRQGREPEAVLRDPNVELSPLFRYVMALTLGLYDLAPRFQEQAVRQLHENTEYFRTFSKFRHVLPAKKEDAVR